MQSGFVLILHSLVYYLCDCGLNEERAEKWSFGRGRASPLFARGMVVPGSRNSEPVG